MKKQIINVGFDLDGVLLYNPARIIRPIMFFIKKYFLKRDLNKFYYPKNKFEKLLWWLLHKSSLWPSPGTKEIIELIENKKIKAYIISARYELLKKDFVHWYKILDPNELFSDYFYNDKNDQPQTFKMKMINKLNLDIFVEDNWDIIKHINSKLNPPAGGKKVKVLWIFNILDRNIEYKYKYSSLRRVVEYLKLITNN